MLPRLEAEERLARINDGQVASGFAERDLVTDTFAALRRAAQVRPARPKKANVLDLAVMGIGVSGPLGASEKASGNG